MARCSFRTAYVDEDDMLVMDPLMIAKRYLKSWFAIDLLSTIPIDLIMSSVMTDERNNFSDALLGLKILGVLRLIRLARIFRVLKLQRVAQLLDDELLLNVALMKILKLIIPIAFLAHFLGCFWWYLLSSDKDNWWTENLLRYDNETADAMNS